MAAVELARFLSLCGGGVLFLLVSEVLKTVQHNI